MIIARDDWQAFDQHLCNLNLRDAQRRMHVETQARRRQVMSDCRKQGQGEGVRLFVRLADSDLAVLREYLLDLDKACRDTWRVQGKAVTPDFVRAMLRSAIVPCIDARRGGIQGDLTLMARRTSFRDLTPVLHHLAHAVNHLKSEVCDRYEAEAITLTYQAARGGGSSGSGERGEVLVSETLETNSQQVASVGRGWDAFISYASEDKIDFALPLAEALRAAGLAIWFDDFELKVGDSLRRSIDRGLAQSRYGIVILSPEFFAKDWPQRELDGLVAKETGLDKVIIPVWHRIDIDDVRRFSPILADRVAAKSSDDMNRVVEKIISAISKARRATK